MATPHIECEINEIAKTVIMPGDPLRAKVIAETFLEDYKLINNVRGMLGYTGKYKDKYVTVMSSGMGMPSIGIYSYELYKFYDVENIIRVGTCGAYTKDLNLYDVILVSNCYSESSYAKTQNGCTDNIMYSNQTLNEKIINAANMNNSHLTIGTIHSSDVFYKENDNFMELYNKYGCIASEMESFALFHNANVLGKKAACLLTVSDNLVTKEHSSSEERQNKFKEMMIIALDSVLL